MIEISGVSLNEARSLGLSDEGLIGLLRKMMEIRHFEEKVEELYLVKGQGSGPCHLYIGQEAIGVGVTSALNPDDLIISNYRGHGHAIARDVPMREVMAELFGKETGTCKGLGGSMHSAISPERGILFASAIVGAGIPIAAGVGLALNYRKDKRIITTFFGDGGVNSGAFHEGVNLAAVWKLPVLLVCENNMYAMGTSIASTTAISNIAERGSAYSIPSISVDGNDVLSVFAATRKATQLIHDGNCPVFLVGRTYRLKGHGVYDKGEYRPKGEAEAWVEKDPITTFQKKLMEAGLISRDEIEEIHKELISEAEDAVKFAAESAVMKFEELSRLVYA